MVRERFQFLPRCLTIPPHSSALVDIDFNWILPESWTHSMRQSPRHKKKNLRIPKRDRYVKADFISLIFHHDSYISKCDTPSSTILVVEVVVFLFLTWPLVLSFCSVLCVSQVHLPQHPSRGDVDAASEWRLLFDIDAPFVVLYANWPGWRRRLFDVQMMILGHCKCANHCFSVNCLPRGVKELY